MGSHIQYWIHEVYLSLVFKTIIKQLLPLLEVDIQIRQPLTGCFPSGKPSVKQPLSGWQIWMSTSNKGYNCIMSTTILHLNNNSTCQQQSYMSATILHVNNNPTCQQQSYMSTIILHVNNNPTCQQQSYMSITILHVNNNPTCQ